MVPSAEQKICQGEDVSYDRDIRHIIRRAVFCGGQALDNKMLGWLALSGAVFTQKCRKMLMRRDPVSATFGNPELCKYSSKVPKPCTHTTPRADSQRQRTLAEIQPKLNGRLQEMSNEWQLDSVLEGDGKILWEGGRDQNLISSTESILAHNFPMSCPTRAQVQLCGFAGKI